MSIIRAARSAEGRYTQILNTALQDHRLSFRARGLMAYLLSLPPSARINSSQLAERTKEGREAIRTALRELEEHGYLRRTKQRTDKGTFRPESVVCDDPELLKGDGPEPENPSPEDPPDSTPPAPRNPAPENPPDPQPPGPRNPTSVSRAPKDKDGEVKRTPSESAAEGGGPLKDDPARIRQLAGFITRKVMEEHPFNNGPAIAGVARSGLKAGVDSNLLLRAIMAAAADDGPVTINSVKHHMRLLTGGYQTPQRPRTVDDPGTRVHDHGLEVLGGPVDAVPPNEAFLQARQKAKAVRHE